MFTNAAREQNKKLLAPLILAETKAVIARHVKLQLLEENNDNHNFAHPPSCDTPIIHKKTNTKADVVPHNSIFLIRSTMNKNVSSAMFNTD